MYLKENKRNVLKSSSPWQGEEVLLNLDKNYRFLHKSVLQIAKGWKKVNTFIKVNSNYYSCESCCHFHRKWKLKRRTEKKTFFSPEGDLSLFFLLHFFSIVLLLATTACRKSRVSKRKEKYHSAKMF